MSKSTKIIAALGVVAGLGVAAMPFAGASANTTQQTDTIDVTIADSCQLTYQSTAHAAGTSTGTWSGNKLTASIANNAADLDIGSTNFNVVCNDAGGYDVKLTASALSGQRATGAQSIDYISSASAPTAGTSNWGVLSGSTWVTSGGKVATASAATYSTDFSVTYGVATSTTQQSDTYEGTAQYDLSHPPSA